MGIQLQVSRKVLEAAGWDCWVETEELWEQTPDGDEYMIEHDYLVVSKDDYTFGSYCDDSLVIDCNHWGSNRAKLIAAGLFDLEHIEG